MSYMKSLFKTYVKITELTEINGGIVVDENFDWAKDIGKMLPHVELDLPLIQKQSKIYYIVDKKNPIHIQLSDGSKLFFTPDEFKRINGKPEIGKTLLVSMQRLQNDFSGLPSKIVSCKVI